MVMEKLCLEVCEDIVHQSSFSDKTVLNFYFKSCQPEEKKVEVKIITKNEQFKFILKFMENETKYIYHHNDVYIFKKNNAVLVNEIDIIGYDEVKFGEATVDQLKLILTTIAERYIKNTFYQPNNPFKSERWNQDLYKALITVMHDENVKEIQPQALLEGIEKFVSSSEGIFTSNEHVYVSSVLQKKVFIKNSICNIMPIGREIDYNLVYDVLLTIFWFSNQMLRQRYFDTLLNYYYDTLKQKLDKNGFSLEKIMSIEAYQDQAHLFHPFVKIHILKQLCLIGTNEEGNGTTLRYKNIILSSILEVHESIRYPRLSREDCYKIIEHLVGSADYHLVTYKIIPLEERAGYLGDYFRVKLNIIIQKEEIVFCLFAKCIPTFAELSKQLAIKSFKKEEFFYQTFIPKLKDTGLVDICDFLPKCYFSRSEDILVFEDVSLVNFTSLKVDIPLPPDLMNKVIKQIAKIHACSLLFEEIMTKKTNKIVRLDEDYREYIEEMVFASSVDKGIKDANECALKTFISMFDLFPEIVKRFSMEEFKSKAKIVFSSIYEKVKKSDNYRNVLCHGDGWAGNLLFRMGPNSESTDCYIIDYQLTRYCPPASDLLYFIYMVTDRDTRTTYMSEFIHEYYLELSRIFRRYNFDLNDIYTYEYFLDCCNYMKSESLTHAAIILQMVLYPIEKIMPILENDDTATRFFSKDRLEFLEEMQIDGPYRNRLRGIIEDLYEYCEIH